MNTERENDWHLREGSAKTFEHFRDVVKGHVDAFSSWVRDVSTGCFLVAYVFPALRRR